MTKYVLKQWKDLLEEEKENLKQNGYLNTSGESDDWFIVTMDVRPFSVEKYRIMGQNGELMDMDLGSLKRWKESVKI
ncbi:MAG: hypothetical protein QXV17_06540 [Candidatus Micrarchaeaceae archaeon]